MVYSPSTYLVSAAIGLMALQIQQTSGASMYYSPETTSGTTDELTNRFPAFGADVADQDCAITVTVDPTLPDITTISTVPVTYPELLANLTTAPTNPLFTKVGTAILSETTPVTETGHDAYTTSSATPTTTVGITTPSAPGKTGITIPNPIAPIVKSEAPKDCATGWEETKPARKLRDSDVAGIALDEKLQTKRQLETSNNQNSNLARLEAYFGSKMEMTLKDLPNQGVFTPSPWAGPYWPTYQDSINVQWQEGEPSPAEKYAKAFGLDVTDFMNKVSKETGIDEQSNRKKCSSQEDCESLTDGSECGIRVGKTSGYCIPTWFGICHAWAPAAILEDEPNCPVTHNGVTFQPMDIKGLITDIYDGAKLPTVYTGARFKGGVDTIDQYGRHSSPAYRDLNPGYFHIAAANLLGMLNTSFVVDVTAGLEVWNQPVRGFKVYEQTAMSLEEAAQTFWGLEAYPWNAAAKSVVYVKARLSWIYETYQDGGLVSSGQIDQFTTGKYYYYLLELDDAGEIIGGEWVYDSDGDHPDFLWFTKSKPAADTVIKTGLSYADVSMLLKKSVDCSDSASASASASTSASASASASTSASTSGSETSASKPASTSGSTSSVTGSASTGSAGVSTEMPATSTTASSAGGNGATETPVATTLNTSPPAATTAAPVATPAAPVSTPAAPVSTPATPGQGEHNNGGEDHHQDHHQNENHHQDQQQQDQQQQDQQQFEQSENPRQSWQSFFHWW